MAAHVTRDSHVNAVVNNQWKRDVNPKRQIMSNFAQFTLQMTLTAKQLPQLFHLLNPAHTGVDGEGWSCVPGSLKELCSEVLV